MISPALFDLYAEDLLANLTDNGWSFEDVLAFADDHLVICDSTVELKNAIQLVNSWCKVSKIQLNAIKSGIVEIIPRRSRLSLEIGSRVDGIPVLSSYKYLGLDIDNKLTGDVHMGLMNRKINFLNCRLAPLLSKISTDFRINLWKVLVKPLYKPVLALVSGNNLSRVKALEVNLKRSMKKFAGLARTTNDTVLERLFVFDIPVLAKKQEEEARRRWALRCNGTEVCHLMNSRKQNTPILPKIFAKYNNILSSKCPKCKGFFRNSSSHLSSVHGKTLPSPLSLINELECDFPRGKYSCREAILKQRELRIKGYLSLLAPTMELA